MVRSRGYLSFGAWAILVIAGVSTVVILARGIWTQDKARPLEFWTFARNHFVMYEPVVERWNAHAKEESGVDVYSLSGDALQRRMMSGFLSGTPVADLIEVERQMAGQAFAGPVEDVGFLDLTDRLRAEGLDERVNPPSFSPWSSRGRIFGLPHDVHPVLLAYRADLLEDQHGIDMSKIETWDDFKRVLRPLVQDIDGDGVTDRFVLAFWETNPDLLETLVLQAGGALFDAEGELVMANPVNARVLAELVGWVAGPERFAAEANNFVAGGYKLKLDGFVVAEIMPDWLAGVWKQDLPGLSGKVKLMPLPAWSFNGANPRRTSVLGGTMLGISKASDDPEAAWTFAKNLYFDPVMAEELFETANIISPLTDLWDRPFYHQSDPYFSGQASGALYIEQAPDVPIRASGPFVPMAMQELQNAFIALRRHAEATDTYDAEALVPVALNLLEKGERQVRNHMERNPFLATGEEHFE